MIKKTIDSDGTVLLDDEAERIVALKTTFDADTGTVTFAIDGILRTDTQAYLDTELSFYCVAPTVKSLVIDCKNLRAISPGCFGKLLDAKIKITGQNKQISFLNKPESLITREKLMGKKL